MKFDLTPKEAGEILGVGHQTVTRYAKDGKLRAYRTPSGRWRFNRADVEALAAEGVIEPTPAVAS